MAETPHEPGPENGTVNVNLARFVESVVDDYGTGGKAVLQFNMGDRGMSDIVAELHASGAFLKCASLAPERPASYAGRSCTPGGLVELGNMGVLNLALPSRPTELDLVFVSANVPSLGFALKYLRRYSDEVLLSYGQTIGLMQEPDGAVLFFRLLQCDNVNRGRTDPSLVYTTQVFALAPPALRRFCVLVQDSLQAYNSGAALNLPK